MASSGEITPPTMLQKRFVFYVDAGAMRARCYPEDYLHFFRTHLNALDQRANQFPAPRPIHHFQPLGHLGSEILPAPDDEMQLGYLLRRILQLPGLFFEARQALFEAFESWGKFPLVLGAHKK